jgi:hypothetical protein
MESDGAARTVLDGEVDGAIGSNGWQELDERLTPLRTAPFEDQRSEPEYATIVVERDDRLATICGKLDGAGFPDVVVRIPHGNSELSTAVGMRLLMRHADRGGKSIVIVTRRQPVRQIARAEGQPYSGSERRVRFGRRSGVQALLGGLDLPVPAVSNIIWLGALLVVLGGLAALIFCVLPDASVTLFPATAAVSQESVFSLDSVANRVDASGAVVPATRRRVAVTRTVLIPVTGAVRQEQATGDPRTVPAVDSSDLERAKALAGPALTDQAMQDLRRRYGSEWDFFPQTADVQVASVVPAQAVGTDSAFLEATYGGSVSVLGARESDIRQLLEPALTKQLQPGVQLIDSSLRLSVLRAGPFEKTGDRLAVQMRLDAASTSVIDMRRISQALRGRSRREALAIADQATNATRAPMLRLWPGWAPWLPRLGSRIRVELAAK